MNVVILSGRLTKKPELRATTSTSVCHFSLAVNKFASNECDFIECVCFGKQAENLAKYQDKGNMIEVNGRLEVNSYTDKEGKNHSKTIVTVNQTNFISQGKKTSSEAKNDQNDPFEAMSKRIEEDNLPF